MLRLFQGATLIAAAMTVGLMAGVFGLYAYAIMPGLGETDDQTFVDAFQSIDEAIVNPLFLATFLGALVFTGLAAMLQLRGGRGDALPWVVVAFLLYLAVFFITARVHVPLNDEIKAAGDPTRIVDLAAARERFDEDRWVGWNIVRAGASTIAFGCLTWALMQYGRALVPREPQQRNPRGRSTWRPRG
jgi:uncharacterized membrane protein